MKYEFNPSKFILHNCILVRGFAFGGIGPRRAGGAIEGGEVFDGNGEVGHLLLLSALFCLIKRVSKAGNRSIMTNLPHNYDGLADINSASET
jgi:hypothetical protein